MGPKPEEPAVHFLAALTVTAYAWLLHSLIGAILTVSVLAFTIGLTNLAIVAAGGGRTLLQISRWVWLAFVLAALLVVGRPAEERDCREQTNSFWALPQLAFCTDHKEELRKSLHKRQTPAGTLG